MHWKFIVQFIQILIVTKWPINFDQYDEDQTWPT